LRKEREEMVEVSKEQDTVKKDGGREKKERKKK
jgi:hypothetical protein